MSDDTTDRELTGDAAMDAVREEFSRLSVARGTAPFVDALVGAGARRPTTVERDEAVLAAATAYRQAVAVYEATVDQRLAIEQEYAALIAEERRLEDAFKSAREALIAASLVP